MNAYCFDNEEMDKAIVAHTVLGLRYWGSDQLDMADLKNEEFLRVRIGELRAMDEGCNRLLKVLF